MCLRLKLLYFHCFTTVNDFRESIVVACSQTAVNIILKGIAALSKTVQGKNAPSS